MEKPARRQKNVTSMEEKAYRLSRQTGKRRETGEKKILSQRKGTGRSHPSLLKTLVADTPREPDKVVGGQKTKLPKKEGTG